MKTQIADWRVRIYDKNDALINSWTIQNRTEHEAEREAAADVDNDSDACDWTLTRINNKRGG